MDYEKAEIAEYTTIYFFPLNERKKQSAFSVS